MFIKQSATALALFNLLLVAGCSSDGMSGLFPSAGDRPFKIESEPSGAEVYVMGKNIGVTPLSISPGDVFPNIYPREKESVYGRVILKKAGCADFTRTVSAEISNAGLRAKLDCGDANPLPPMNSPPQAPSPTPSGSVPRGSETVEQRLDKIRDLLGKGLISEEEAKKTRERILNEL